MYLAFNWYKYISGLLTDCAACFSLEVNLPDLITSTTTPSLALKCPDDVVVKIDVGDPTADVNITGPSGDAITTRLTAGEFNFSYSLEDGRTCSYTVSIQQGLMSNLNF